MKTYDTLACCLDVFKTYGPRDLDDSKNEGKKKSVHLVDLTNSYTTNILGQLQNHFPTSKKKNLCRP